MTGRHRRLRGDAGFTVIELATAMVLFGVVSAIAIGSFAGFRNANAQKGAFREVVSSLRSVQARAVSEASTFCVDFGGASSTQWSVYRVPAAGTGVLPATFSCTSGTKVLGPEKVPSKTTLTNISFSQRNGTTTSYVLFYARGAASPGALDVTRPGSTKTYSLTVDALTGRVADPSGS